jgi:hypothetical protein
MGIRPPVTIPSTDREFINWCRQTSPDNIITGTGSPAGVVVANRGTIFLRTDGGAGTTLYVKESNDGNFNGWTAK